MRRRRATHVELAIGGCFTLFDFYLGSYSAGIRPFDLLGFGVLGMSRAGATAVPARWSPWRRIGAVLVLGVMTWALTLSMLHNPADNWKPVTGVALGLIIFILTCNKPAGPTAVERLTRILILTHAAALVVQFVWYRLTATILNFHAVTGGDPRLVGAFFRPAGLFLEPSLFSVCMTMLIMLRFRAMGRLDRICVCGLASMILSLSLLGIAAVAYLLVRARPVIGAIVSSAVVSAGVVAVSLLPRDSAVYSLIVARVTNIDSDNSAQYRFGGLFGANDETGVVAWLFGGGIGYDYVALGSSGVGFAIAAVGAVGLALFMLGISLAARSRDRLTAPLDVLFLLLGAPFWTVFLWWWWLASLLNVRGPVPTSSAAPLPKPRRSGLVPPIPLNVQPD